MQKIAILGLGEGRSTISAALQSDKLELVKMCDRNIDLCKQRAAEFNFHSYTTDYNELLQDATIDIIAIYTPDHLHAQHIKMALEHGKHVVCTKPFIDNLADAKSLLLAQQKSGKKVFVGQSSRFFCPSKSPTHRLRSGRNRRTHHHRGALQCRPPLVSEKEWALSDKFKWLYGGLSHPVDFVRWYLPNITEVMGYGTISANGKAAGLKNEDCMHFIFKADDGRIARVSGTYTSPTQPAQRESGMSCVLRGTQGASVADYHELRYAITNKSGEEKIITWGDDTIKYFFRFEGQSHHAGEYQNYLEYFADSIEQGFTASPDMHEGIGTIALLQAMERTLETGMPVKLSDVLSAYGL